MTIRASLAQVADFLETRLGGGVTNVTPMEGGEWSQAYEYDIQGESYVIRFSEFSEDFTKDQLAGSWSSSALPVPKVIKMGHAFNGWYAITKRLTGVFLEDLDAAAFARTLPSVLEAVAAMRQVDVSTNAGFGPWDSSGSGQYRSWREYLLDVEGDTPGLRTHGWRTSLATDPPAQAQFLSSLARLREAISVCPEKHELIHNDMLNRNVFVENDRLNGVIDWGVSLYGDSLYDIALLDFWAPWFGGMRHADILGSARRRFSDQTRDFDGCIRAYQIHIGLIHIGYNSWLKLEGRERPGEMVRVCARTEEVGTA